MKVTAIKAQVKRPGRYSIFVDGTYAFSLSDSALLESDIVNGQDLTAGELETYKKISVDDKLWGKVLRYLALRDRSRQELAQYLKRQEVSPEDAQVILGRLDQKGLINDEAFAKSWVENRRVLKPTSRRKLAQELRAKGIAPETIQAVLSDAADEPVDDQATLASLIARKRRQAKYQDDTKLMQYLARQGFDYEDIKAALHEDKY